MKLIVHTDGGARGNPGPAAVGVVIEESEQGTGNDKRKTVHKFGKVIGETTNNVAEYSAVIEALTYIKSNFSQNAHDAAIHFILDSTLVVNQLNGLFKVKDLRLRELLSKVRILEQEVGGTITYTSVPREQNRSADYLVNTALDEAKE